HPARHRHRPARRRGRDGRAEVSTPTATKSEAKTSDSPSTAEPPKSGGRPGADEGSRTPGPLSRATANPKALLLLAAVLTVVVSAWVTDSSSWPDALTFDIRTPLTDLDNWLVDNRDTSPL